MSCVLCEQTLPQYSLRMEQRETLPQGWEKNSNRSSLFDYILIHNLKVMKMTAQNTNGSQFNKTINKHER